MSGRRQGLFGLPWIEDPVIHGLGCGDSSCKYVKPTGMSTNGGCRCSRNHGEKVERFLLRELGHLVTKIDRLQAEIEVDRMLNADGRREK
jgi:hypothetical protein